jgi:hypothetical protein
MHTDTIPIHRSRDSLLHIPGIEIITCAVSNGIHPGVSPNLANLQARRRAVSRVHHEDGGEEAREVAEHAPTAALVFKIMTDAYVGQLAFLRVYSGSLPVGDHVLNTTKGVRERVVRLLRSCSDTPQTSSLCRRDRHVYDAVWVLPRISQ